MVEHAALLVDPQLKSTDRVRASLHLQPLQTPVEPQKDPLTAGSRTAEAAEPPEWDPVRYDSMKWMHKSTESQKSVGKEP